MLVCDRDVPGIAERDPCVLHMTKTRRAMPARRVHAAWYTLVINFPTTKAARESWEAVSDQPEHAARDDSRRRARQSAHYLRRK